MAYNYQYVRDHTPADYVFPTHRLKRTCDPNRTPLVLVACGSCFDVIGGYLSPVSDSYKKTGLAPAHHRVRMCELAVESTTKWLMVDPWEAEKDTYVPTANVLDHFHYHFNHVMGGVECSDGSRKPVRIVLLAGADLIQTIGEPGKWDPRDVAHILGDYGVFILERTGTDLKAALETLNQWEKNIHVIRQHQTKTTV
ncbi:Nicotinamide-nucleotide adenylyltransferase 1 [Escovopsis weberi]|uniref:Nicotinamide-nucleotide adenylyltransferase 1 n=1 Tax=Escovopsis weberi TaxID=150374 RepID=A0A0M8N9H2_ESCWE|nr:Nicotinamide-nucleotide adenylyltransferase 1 [Escovopsis weberi]